MTDIRTDADPLLSGVRAALETTGLLGWRAWCHPGRSCAVAVRGLFPADYGTALERAGYQVERGAGWLTVSAR